MKPVITAIFNGDGDVFVDWWSLNVPAWRTRKGRTVEAQAGSPGYDFLSNLPSIISDREAWPHDVFGLQLYSEVETDGYDATVKVLTTEEL